MSHSIHIPIALQAVPFNMLLKLPFESSRTDVPIPKPSDHQFQLVRLR